MEWPIIITDNGIKLQPENMVKEELYHCIYQNRIFLFYKDNDEIIHCYELGDPNIIMKIRDNPDKISEILNNLAQYPENNKTS